VICEYPLPYGDFELGVIAPWALFDSAYRVPGIAHTGDHSIRLGGTVNTTGDLAAGLELPGDAGSIVLWYYWLVEGQEPESLADYLVTVIRHDETDDAIDVVAADMPKGEWYLSAVDLTGYRGQTVILIFHAHNNESNPTTFYVDDVGLEVCDPVPSGRQLYLPLVMRGA
jgi:hypothetical protein